MNINSVPVQTKYYNFTLHRLHVYTIYSTLLVYKEFLYIPEDDCQSNV